MPETQYKESDDFVPDATHQTGTVDTSGTAGTAHARIEEVTQVFDEAKKQDAITAARALDPDDDGVDAQMVTLPTGVHVVSEDPQAAVKRLQAAGKAATSKPRSSRTKAQAEAAEGEEPAKSGK